MPPRPRRRRPVTQSGNLNPRSVDFRRAAPVGTGVVQRDPRSAPRPAVSPNPAAAVLGQDPVTLTGEERMLAGDPHAFPAREIRQDPVFRFAQPTIRGAGELGVEILGGRAFGDQIPTNYQQQEIGTGIVVSRKGGAIRTAEWEAGNRLRRQWERAEQRWSEGIKAGDEGNERLQQAVIDARKALFDSPLFDARGAIDEPGQRFWAYQRDASGQSIVDQPQQPLTPGGLEAPPGGLAPEQMGDTAALETLREARNRFDDLNTGLPPEQRASQWKQLLEQQNPELAKLWTGREEWKYMGDFQIGETQFTGGVRDGVAQVTGRPSLQGLTPGRVPTPITQIDGVWTGRGVPRPEGAPARITRAERVQVTRERGDLIGAPPGDKPVTQGQLSIMKNRLSVAKRADQKAALIKKWEAAAKKRGVDLTTAAPYMKLKEAEFKRGAKKRLDRQEQQDINDALEGVEGEQQRQVVERLRKDFGDKAVKKNRSWRQADKQAPERVVNEQEQQDITNAFTKLPPGRNEEMIKRLDGLFDRDALMQNPAFRQAVTQSGMKLPKEPKQKGRLTAAKKAALSKSDLTAMKSMSKSVDEALKGRELEQLEAFTEWYETQLKMHMLAGVPIDEFNKRVDGAMASRPELFAEFRNKRAASERFVSEGGGTAGPGATGGQQAPEPVGQPLVGIGGFTGSAGLPQPAQRPNMGTSPIVETVRERPPGRPDFAEDLSFFTEMPDGSGEWYDERTNTKLTIGKDGRRYWTYVVVQGGKQVSQTVELEGGGPPPNFGQEAEAGVGAAAKPAVKAAPAAKVQPQAKSGEAKKQLQADIDQALSGGL